jgi:hypothetical protein
LALQHEIAAGSLPSSLRSGGHPQLKCQIDIQTSVALVSTRLGFADESGTDGNPDCYGIGVLSFPDDRRLAFDALFSHLAGAHGLISEQKWEKISTGHARMNFLLDFLYRILQSSSAAFDMIVVNKRLFRLWNEAGCDRESAFYMTYTHLLTHAAKRTGDEFRIFVDGRSDAYARQTEVIQIVGNNMLKNLADSGRLADVKKVDSKQQPAIQVADLLTGAITCAHRGALSPAWMPHRGKALCMQRMAEMLGWPDLVCDTMPDSRFNIWHFPIEYRAAPETRSIGFVNPPRYVTQAHIDQVGVG